MTFDNVFDTVMNNAAVMELDSTTIYQAKSLFELAYLLGKSEGISEAIKVSQV